MKRAIDVVLAIFVALLFVPFALLLIFVIYFNIGHPVLFTQVRPGLRGNPFRMYKFRTMRTALGTDGKPLPDDQRLTAFGRFLRSSSIDELPELWNVIKGDMSLVGPRPLLMEYLPRYSARQARRHEVRPGITGWAQVNGRNTLSWEEKFEMDVWYVENSSFWLDIKILWRTLLAVARRKGINKDGYATMPPFLGSKDVEVS